MQHAPHFATKASALLLLTAILGCGAKPTKTMGVVKLEGKAVDGASVTFVPDGAEGKPAHATTDAEGRFNLFTQQAEGAYPGKYRVLVSKFDSDPALKKKGMQAAAASLLPQQYASEAKTPLRFAVPHDGPVALDLQNTP